MVDKTTLGAFVNTSGQGEVQPLTVPTLACGYLGAVLKVVTQNSNTVILEGKKLALLPGLGVSNPTPTAGDKISFFLSNAWSAVSKVVYTIGTTVKEVVYSASNPLFEYTGYQANSTQTVVADLYNGSTKLTSLQKQIDVAARVLPTATIDAIKDTGGATITKGSTTTETKPKLNGTLSASLTTGQVLRVIDNSGTSSEQIYQASVSGTNWTLQIGTALASGSHSFTAQVFDGVNIVGGTPSTSWPITVNAGTVTTSKLPHSGITSSQCYAAGSNTLVACSGAASTLNGQQDGHRASINAMSYSKVGFNGEDLADNASSWCAVKDKVTGLMWQNQSATGTYTNYGDNRVGDASKYAADNATLCGLSGWRLPTVDELQTIVDYSKPYPGPTINTTWFPNTPGYLYWSSSPYVGDSNYAWGVGFHNGDVTGFNYGAVRLVRANQ